MVAEAQESIWGQTVYSLIMLRGINFWNLHSSPLDTTMLCILKPPGHFEALLIASSSNNHFADTFSRCHNVAVSARSKAFNTSTWNALTCRSLSRTDLLSERSSYCSFQIPFSFAIWQEY